MNIEERKAIALERKRKLASRLDSNELLLLSLRFYLGILEPGRPVAASLAYDRSKDLTHRVKTHLRGARRILGVTFTERGRLMRLPLCYWRRLIAIGLQWNDSGERKRFEALNTNLVVDEATTLFALTHYVLGPAKEFLRGPEPAKPAFPRPQLDSYATHLQHHVMDNLREGLLFGRD
jgi:hypothetical protein